MLYQVGDTTLLSFVQIADQPVAGINPSDVLLGSHYQNQDFGKAPLDRYVLSLSLKGHLASRLAISGCHSCVKGSSPWSQRLRGTGCLAIA